MQTPLFARKFVLDAVETGLGLIFALEIVFPTTVPEAQQTAVIFGGAALAATVSAARRAVPGFLAWFRGVLAIPDEE